MDSLEPIVALLGQKVHGLQVPALGGDFQVAEFRGDFTTASGRARPGQGSGGNGLGRFLPSAGPIARTTVGFFVLERYGQPRKLAGAGIVLQPEMRMP
jgi:hypothetical protein